MWIFYLVAGGPINSSHCDYIPERDGRLGEDFWCMSATYEVETLVHSHFPDLSEGKEITGKAHQTLKRNMDFFFCHLMSLTC